VWHRQPFGDVWAEIDARLALPVENASPFLDFRIQANGSRYRFSIDPSSGQFALRLLVGNQSTALLDDTLASAINHGTALNRLGVRVQAEDIVLLVNGAEVGRAHDPTLREGRIGFGVTNARGEPAEARFSSLVVVNAHSQ
jgi:hypothetical protein